MNTVSLPTVREREIDLTDKFAEALSITLHSLEGDALTTAVVEFMDRLFGGEAAYIHVIVVDGIEVVMTWDTVDAMNSHRDQIDEFAKAIKLSVVHAVVVPPDNPPTH